MKINLKVRGKNPWFWVGLGGVILTSMGVSPEMFTSWSAVLDAIKELFLNPYMLVSVVLAVLGVVVDPTTYGIADSTSALTYNKPKK